MSVSLSDSLKEQELISGGQADPAVGFTVDIDFLDMALLENHRRAPAAVSDDEHGPHGGEGIADRDRRVHLAERVLDPSGEVDKGEAVEQESAQGFEEEGRKEVLLDGRVLGWVGDGAEVEVI